jgi:hypothetical protein
MALRILAHSLEQNLEKAMPVIEDEDEQSEPEYNSREVEFT